MERIQGTDGVRGIIQTKPVESAIKHFLDTKELSIKFFEVYAFCFVEELIASDLASQGDSIVIGYDIRSDQGKCYHAAIQGIQKAGCVPVLVDVLPTPAVVLHMIESKAAAAIMITASHNPANQNGIKTFIGLTGLKPLPYDDVLLTKRILQIDESQIDQKKALTQIKDSSKNAYSGFIQYCSNPLNSYLKKASDHISIIIDGANGATSLIIQDIAKQLQLKNVFYTNCDPSSNINNFCGVADLEGLQKIASDQIESGKFANYKALQLLLKKGRDMRTALKDGHHLCIAFVFDGDGDRFFMLTYEPVEDQLLVISGDQLAYMKANFFTKQEMLATPLFCQYSRK